MSDRLHRVRHAPGGARGDRVVLDRDESVHLCRVLRLRAGATIGVFDGAGREWEAVLETADPSGAVAVLDTERTDPVESPLEVTLVQALCRPERMEWLLQKGTEIGVCRFVLFRGERSEWGEPSPTRRSRWEKIVSEACRQCGRRTVPALVGPVSPPVALEEGEFGVVLDPGAEPLGSVLDGEVPRSAAVAVGPEGGYEEDERRAWIGAGWKPVGLGPRILRTETAGVVAASLLLHRWADLGGR